MQFSQATLPYRFHLRKKKDKGIETRSVGTNFVPINIFKELRAFFKQRKSSKDQETIFIFK